MILSDIVNAYPTLVKLSKIEDLPTNVKYKIAITLNGLMPSIRFFEEQKRSVFEKYGDTNDSGELIVKSENVEAFTKEIDDLCNTETEEFQSKCDISCGVDLPISAEEIITIIPFFNFVD